MPGCTVLTGGNQNLAPVWTITVFKKVDALPCAKAEATVHDWNCQADRQNCRLDVGGHVIRPFRAVTYPIHRRIGCVRRKPLEKRMKIRLDRRIRVFLDQQGTRGMANEQVQQPGILRKCVQMFGELVKAGPTCFDDKCFSHGMPGA